MCKPEAHVIAGDGEYIVRTFCATHNPGGIDSNRVAESVIPESRIPEFLDRGYLGVTLGVVEREVFDAVLDGLVSAGSESAATFKRELSN